MLIIDLTIDHGEITITNKLIFGHFVYNLGLVIIHFSISTC